MLEQLSRFSVKESLVWQDESYTYEWLLKRVAEVESALPSGLTPGAVVSIEADFCPDAVAWFFALAKRRQIVVPLTSVRDAEREKLLALAQVRYRVLDCETGRGGIYARDARRASETEGTTDLYEILRARGHAGLVLFSSGSTGAVKGAVHDLEPLFARFAIPRKAYRAVAFLLFDHIGGINTMLHILASGGCLVTVADRRPETVLAAVEKHRVELLPASPTFLNMILLSEAWRDYDLGSLQVVSYGTEPMPISTLRRFHELFPDVRLQQTYGLSEIGIPSTKSRASDSLWMRIGGEGVETRVVDGILQIRSATAMLGYLNAPSPFTDDGWLSTGDAVEVDGEYFRILGREDDRINVGGEKVYPAEVEAVLLEMPEVAEAVVYGEKNLLTGTIVCADVQPTEKSAESMEAAEFRRQLREHCRQRLARHKVPVRINLIDRIGHTERFKKQR